MTRLGRAGICSVVMALLLGAVSGSSVPSLRSMAEEETKRLANDIEEISQQLWRLAEPALKERASSALLADSLEREGFRVERGVAGMPTAFVASWGDSGPTIGLLADYDALPETGNVVEPRRAARGDGVTSGHACGHHLIAAGAAAAAIAVKRVLEKRSVPGRLRLFGTPAEENKVGKVYMAREGVFAGLDACLAWHPAPRTAIENQSGTAMNDFRVGFSGRSAHSSARPWEGRSALDALEMFDYGINLLREHMRPTSRIQYVITGGGSTPRDVPDRAEGWYWVRDPKRAEVELLFERIRRLAAGVAMATETESRVTLNTGVHPVLLNRPLQEAVFRNLVTVGPPVFDAADEAFAGRLQEELGLPRKPFNLQIHPLPEGVSPPAAGSNDLAEVSRLAPTVRLLMTALPPGIELHEWSATAFLGRPASSRTAGRAAAVLALTLVDLLTDADLRERARSAFLEATGGHPYVSPVAGREGLPPPLPGH